MHTNVNHVIHIPSINMKSRHEKYKNVKDNKFIFLKVLEISVCSMRLLICLQYNESLNTVHSQDTRKYYGNIDII